MTATHAKIPMTNVMQVKPVALAFDPVVSRNTWTCCEPSGVSNTDIVSPTQNANVMAIIHPRIPLPSHVHIMARGMTCDALRTSSDMCAPASTPTKTPAAPVRPTMVARGTLPHIMLSSKAVNTAPDGLLSPMTQSGMITAKNPARWRMTIMPSMSGSFFAQKMLKNRQTTRIAQTINIPCHGCGAYEGFQRMISADICLPVR